MDYKIRKIKEAEYSVLSDFLYEAIFIPEGVKSPPREIIEQPELQVYISDFGKHKGDCCLVAELDKRIIGAVWVRIMNDYGHIDDETPSFAISLYPEYRNHGIGTALMKSMLKLLKAENYKQASLAVQKANYAVKMYKNVGFEIVGENTEEYIMAPRNSFSIMPSGFAGKGRGKNIFLPVFALITTVPSSKNMGSICGILWQNTAPGRLKSGFPAWPLPAG